MSHHPTVRVLQTAEDPVVDQPDPADREEARHIRQVGRPLVSDPLPEILETGLGHADLENQQRDRDREDAITESFDPTRTPAISHADDTTPPRTALMTQISGRPPDTYRRASISVPPADHPAAGPRNWLTSSIDCATTASVIGLSNNSRPSH